MIYNLPYVFSSVRNMKEKQKEKQKEMAIAPVLAKNNVRLRPRVTADSSSYALGVALFQLNSEGKWQPVAFVSTKLTDTERKYAQLEKEALAIT